MSGDAWIARRRALLEATQFTARAETLGRVVRVGDGVASVAGLPAARLGELLMFEGQRAGFVLSLDADVINAVVLDDGDGVEAGSSVTRTGRVVTVPVGESLFGRVVDPLGRPMDGGPSLRDLPQRAVERDAPPIIDRDFVSEPLLTGVLAVDGLFPIGRGQRELIIGDRATGKTSLALEAILNQRGSDVYCVYVAIGQRASDVQRAIDAVRRHGDAERCVFVVAAAASSAGLQWLAPFAGFTMAEEIRDEGGHALIVIDDLSKHAATHRELALLTLEPPGREAYPGDVFYLHARLLERAARLAPSRGGGSLTALPIAETDAGNLTAYIPTNLISITDGQIVLSSRLFAGNQRPAIDVGLSVSRVGGKAQSKGLREAAGQVRLDYAQFLEIEGFTRFGAITDPRIRRQLRRGERIRALLTQPRFSPLAPAEQVALLSALRQGELDDLPLDAFASLRRRVRDRLGPSGSLPTAVRERAVDGDTDAIATCVNDVREVCRSLGAGREHGSE
jgi:F-type H+-transporting ATPase subunit alpha